MASAAGTRMALLTREPLATAHTTGSSRSALRPATCWALSARSSPSTPAVFREAAVVSTATSSSSVAMSSSRASRLVPWSLAAVLKRSRISANESVASGTGWPGSGLALGLHRVSSSGHPNERMGPGEMATTAPRQVYGFESPSSAGRSRSAGSCAPLGPEAVPTRVQNPHSAGTKLVDGPDQRGAPLGQRPARLGGLLDAGASTIARSPPRPPGAVPRGVARGRCRRVPERCSAGARGCACVSSSPRRTWPRAPLRRLRNPRAPARRRGASGGGSPHTGCSPAPRPTRRCRPRG